MFLDATFEAEYLADKETSALFLHRMQALSDKINKSEDGIAIKLLFEKMLKELVSINNSINNKVNNKTNAQKILVNFFLNETVIEFVNKHNLINCQGSLLQALDVDLQMHQLDLFNLDLQIERIKNLTIDSSYPDNIEIHQKFVTSLIELRKNIEHNINIEEGWSKNFSEVNFTFFYEMHDDDIIKIRTTQEIKKSHAAQLARETSLMLQKIKFQPSSFDVDQEIIKNYYQNQLSNRHLSSNFIKAISVVTIEGLASISGAICGTVAGIVSLNPVNACGWASSWAYKSAKVAGDFVKEKTRLEPTDSLSHFLMFKPSPFTSAAINVGKSAEEFCKLKVK